jgi:hypothetical protein
MTAKGICDVQVARLVKGNAGRPDQSGHIVGGHKTVLPSARGLGDVCGRLDGEGGSAEDKEGRHYPSDSSH